MKKRFNYIVFLILILWSVLGQSQQIQQYSQYYLNKFLFNTGIAGIYPYYQARVNNRYQWIGMTDAPKTFTLSLYGPDRKREMGYGGYVFSDVTGPTSRTGFYGAYSYLLKLRGNDRLALSLSAGFLQYKIDGSKITLHDDYDPSLGNQVYSSYLPDANFSVYYKTTDYFTGISFMQLFNNVIKFDGDIFSVQDNRVRTHFFIIGGYNFEINNDWDIVPSTVIKGMWPTPVQLDLTIRGVYKKMLWAGFTYRTLDAVALMIGYEYDKQIMFGYSYDYSITNLKNYNSGTHELMIGYKFSKIKRTSFHSKID